MMGIGALLALAAAAYGVNYILVGRFYVSTDDAYVRAAKLAISTDVSGVVDRVMVREGQHVTTGERLGLSGATGRVTGPHLHWAVRWQGAYLDPAKMLKLDLNGVR